MRIVEFGEWKPDLEGVELNATQELKNVTPGPGFYRPFKEVTPFSQALAALPRGAISGVNPSGDVFMYAGSNNNGAGQLWELQSDSSWTDVTKSGGYSISIEGSWDFERFGSNVIACEGTIAPQVFDQTSSTTFTDLGGTPPTASYVKTIRDHVFLSGLASDPTKVQWSAINDITGWTDGTDLAGSQTFPDVGECKGVFGSNVAYIFFDRAIYRGQYVGPPLVWQFDRISDGRGAIDNNLICEFGGIIFFLSEDGFFMLAGDAVEPIGHEKVDVSVLNDLDRSNLWQSSSTVDPVQKFVMFSYPSGIEIVNRCNRIVCYSWATQRWTEVEYECAYLLPARTFGYSIDGMDLLSTSLDALEISLDDPSLQSRIGQAIGFNTSYQVGPFTGSTLQATLETSDHMLIPYQMSFVHGVRPMTDAPNVTVQMRSRDRMADDLSNDTAESMEDHGLVPKRATGRYHRAKVVIPAAEVWDVAQGLEFYFKPAGQR